MFLLDFFKRFYRLRLFKYQVKVFLDWRQKHGMGTRIDERWLFSFLRRTGKANVLDITMQDVESFLDYVAKTNNGKWPVFQAEKCVRQFIKFYSARGKMSGTIADYNNVRYVNNVHLLANTKRNKDLIRRRLKNPKKWSWRRLGDYYGIHFTTAKQIFERDVNRQAGKGSYPQFSR